jgi:hypothetical protein
MEKGRDGFYIRRTKKRRSRFDSASTARREAHSSAERVKWQREVGLPGIKLTRGAQFADILPPSGWSATRTIGPKRGSGRRYLLVGQRRPPGGQFGQGTPSTAT